VTSRVSRIAEQFTDQRGTDVTERGSRREPGYESRRRIHVAPGKPVGRDRSDVVINARATAGVDSGAQAVEPDVAGVDLHLSA